MNGQQLSCQAFRQISVGKTEQLQLTSAPSTLDCLSFDSFGTFEVYQGIFSDEEFHQAFHFDEDLCR